jgi:hypothetical protein
LLLTLIAIGVIAVGGVLVSAGEILRLTRNVPGDSKPIILYSDHITTWVEGNRRIILLQGVVLAEQGITQLRMQQGVAWIDLERTRKLGILHVDIYAEGDVRLENGTDHQFGPRALVELNTRGELKLKAQQGRIIQEARPNDPVYRRAIAERQAAPPPPSEAKPAGSNPSSPPPKTRKSWYFPPQPMGAATPAATGASTTTIPVVPVQGGSDYAPIPTPPAPAAPSVPTIPVPGPPGAAPTAPAPIGPDGANAVVPGVPGAVPPGDAAPGPTVAPAAPARNIRVVPRTQAPFQVQEVALTNGEKAIVVTGGIIMSVMSPSAGLDLLDIEADRLVIWTRGDSQQVFNDMSHAQGHTGREVEFYLAGNVELREKGPKENRTLRADEMYYDVSRNVAVAYQGDLEFKQPGLPDPIHMKADEILQLSMTKFESVTTDVFSSRLPSDPGLKVHVQKSHLEQKRTVKRRWFGLGSDIVDSKTGQPQVEVQQIFTGNNVTLEVEDIPIFWMPWVQGDPKDPLGPLRSINLNFSQMYGFQAAASLNMFDLLSITPPPGMHWRGDLDYLSYRGPAMGTNIDYAGKDLMGPSLPGNYLGQLMAWGIYDRQLGDVLGGGRGDITSPEFVGHPAWRGRFTERHMQELGEDFLLQFQFSALSDKNFLEEYYWREFNTDINQETFLYLKYQHDNYAVTGTVQPNIRNWVNEGTKLPEFRGYLIGQDFFNLLTYNTRVNLGYNQLRVSDVPPPNTGLTSFAASTGRFDVWQEVFLPFYLGPVKVMPYAVLDLADYTSDLSGSDLGRVYYGGGVRASMPLTRIYPDVHSELFNLDGINHKMVFSANYYNAYSTQGFNLFPQIDRLNDDATDQSIRDMNANQFTFNPANAGFLTTSTYYDPQTYAIRRLLALTSFNYLEAQDTIQVLELDWRQRLQTKRGYPGMEHIIDWMVLDLSTSYYPNPARDNYGQAFAFMQYDYVWNVGDRTAIVSDGWYDPLSHGARWYNIGAFLNRPDRTSFYVGYRQTDPLQSKLVSASASYIFSPKYAVTASTSYDFGTNSGIANGITFTRMGADVQVSLGISYNAILQNFSFNFSIMPNLALGTGRTIGAGSSMLGSGIGSR